MDKNGVIDFGYFAIFKHEKASYFISTRFHVIVIWEHILLVYSILYIVQQHVPPRLHPLDKVLLNVTKQVLFVSKHVFQFIVFLSNFFMTICVTHKKLVQGPNLNKINTFENITLNLNHTPNYILFKIPLHQYLIIDMFGESKGNFEGSNIFINKIRTLP
jgi:hypothetical protein